jgi:nicotinamidase-related amidase
MTGWFFVLALGAMTAAVSAKTALIVIDVQDCFLDASTTSGQPGSLAVPSSQIIPLINSIRNEKSCLFDLVVRTQDYHPAQHISYGSTHNLSAFSHLGGKGGLPMKCLTPANGNTAEASCCPTYYLTDYDRTNCSTTLCPPVSFKYEGNNAGIVTKNTACQTCKTSPDSCFDTTQAMWTDHCLRSGDAGFPPSLVKKADDVIVQKGKNQYVDAYSAFMDNTQNLKTELDSVLQANGITDLYVAGIATDVCVHATVRDAFHNQTGKYTVKVITDATAAVQGNQANFDKANKEMKGFGATMVTTAEVLKMSCPGGVVSGTIKKTLPAFLFVSLAATVMS